MLEKLYEISEGKKVRYVGRPAMSSTSEGDGDSHKAAQAKLVAEALEK